MNKFEKILCGAMLYAALPLAAEVTINSISHNPQTGVTHISWQGVPENCIPVIYRSSDPLTGDNMFFAQKYYFEPGSSNCEIAAPATGKVYYYAGAMKKNRQLTGKISAGKCIDETDRTAPSPRQCQLDTTDKLKIKLLQKSLKDPDGAVKLRLLAKKSMQDKPVILAEKNLRKYDSMEVDPAQPFHFYTLSVADAAGNASLPYNWIKLSSQPDLGISVENDLLANRDLSISERYPVINKPTEIKITVHNYGGSPADGKVLLKVTEADKKSVTLPEITLKAVPARSTRSVKFSYQAAVPGKVRFTVQIISDNDEDQSNNNVFFDTFNVKKPLYFFWYGSNVMNLRYANYAGVSVNDKAEWQRRGNKALVVTSRNLNNNSAKTYIDRTLSGNYNGMQVDEVGHSFDPAQYLPSMLNFKKALPEKFLAVWHVGVNIKEPLATEVKNNNIDLLLLEVYFTANDAQSRVRILKKLEERVREAVKHCPPEKMLIALATSTDFCSMSATAEEQADFIVEQIKVIRKVAPQMPGIAFFSSKAYPEVLKKADEACRKYFLENQQ